MAESPKKDSEEKAAESLHSALSLSLKKRYSFRGPGASNAVVGTLTEVHDLGVVVKQDGHEKNSFLPWHNIFAIEPAE